MLMKNTKGQDLSIGTLILIVLGIIVLVLLILGFTIGWGNLWDKINIFGGSSTLSDVTTACKLAATSQDVYSFCLDFNNIDVNGRSEYVNCQDDRLRLDDRLNCPRTEYSSRDGTTTADITPDQRQCLLLQDGAGASFNPDETYVNSFPCTDILSLIGTI
jgi:hypothetical protein